MIDTGIVVAVEHDKARVKIAAQTVCGGCSAQSFCQGEKASGGTLMALNPLQASPGDAVKIDIPEETYNAKFLRLFGGWLIAALAGLALGKLASELFRLPTSAAGFVGLLCGIAAGGVVIFFRFRSLNDERLYPVIVDILTESGEPLRPSGSPFSALEPEQAKFRGDPYGQT